MMNSQSEKFDVIIIGGGPAGTAAAITLSNHGLHTAIIEKSTYQSIRIGETLSPPIRSLLVILGLWHRFLADDHIESSAINSAWGTNVLYEREHIYDLYGCGWHVNRNRFDYMLATGARDAGAVLFTNTHISNLSRLQTQGWRIAFSQPNCQYLVQAPFLIDATGRTSALSLGFQRSYHVIDHLIGVVYLFDKFTGSYTLIESVSNGWWYSAALPNDRLIVVHMTDADLFASSRCSLFDYWYQNIAKTEHTSIRVGSQAVINKPKIVSASSIIRRPVCGRDWLAAGDACTAFDPLSGQGMYNALKGGIFAAENVIASFDNSSKSSTNYTKWIESQFSNYLKLRYAFYNKEQRWPCHTFWSRRHSPPNV
jgi:flavin-dependent dehydrogenase